MPKAPKGQWGFAQGHLFSIPVGSQNIEAVWTLLEWIGSYEGQKAVIVHRDRRPLGPYPELWDLFFAGVGPEKALKLKQWVGTTFNSADLARVFNYWETHLEVTKIMTQATNNILSSSTLFCQPSPIFSKPNVYNVYIRTKNRCLTFSFASHLQVDRMIGVLFIDAPSFKFPQFLDKINLDHTQHSIVIPSFNGLAFKGEFSRMVGVVLFYIRPLSILHCQTLSSRLPKTYDTLKSCISRVTKVGSMLVTVCYGMKQEWVSKPSPG